MNPSPIEGTTRMSELKVGSIIYGWNAEPITITGETKVSWLIGERDWDRKKISKKSMRELGHSGEDYPQHWVSKEDVELHVFHRNNKYKLANFIEYRIDAKMFKAVADLVGYVEETNGKR